MNVYSYALVAVSVIVAAALAAIGSELPPQAWALVGLAIGAAAPRPGDVSAAQVARELEQVDPTQQPPAA